MEPALRRHAEAARGFMPADEGDALYEAAASVSVDGPLLEVGTYCGKSTIYLAAAARERGTVVVTIDHHRGSEEHQVGEEYHDPDLLDTSTGRVDSLPELRRTLHAAGLEQTSVAIVRPVPVVTRPAPL